MSQYISKFENWVNRGHWTIIAVAFITLIALTGCLFGMIIAVTFMMDELL